MVVAGVDICNAIKDYTVRMNVSYSVQFKHTSAIRVGRPVTGRGGPKIENLAPRHIYNKAKKIQDPGSVAQGIEQAAAVR